MSEYTVRECNIDSEEDVIQGLLDMGLTMDQIEIHPEPVSLVGYRGDTRAQKANIVVRRRNIDRRLSSGSSNDIGFEKQGDGYKAHISEYDLSWWRRKEGRFKQVAAAAKTERIAKKKGYSVKRIEENNQIRLLCKKH